jgi:hypothetical protein
VQSHGRCAYLLDIDAFAVALQDEPIEPSARAGQPLAARVRQHRREQA